jgi:hypothetical protein
VPRGWQLVGRQPELRAVLRSLSATTRQWLQRQPRQQLQQRQRLHPQLLHLLHLRQQLL